MQLTTSLRLLFKTQRHNLTIEMFRRILLIGLDEYDQNSVMNVLGLFTTDEEFESVNCVHIC